MARMGRGAYAGAYNSANNYNANPYGNSTTNTYSNPPANNYGVTPNNNYNGTASGNPYSAPKDEMEGLDLKNLRK